MPVQQLVVMVHKSVKDLVPVLHLHTAAKNAKELQSNHENAKSENVQVCLYDISSHPYFCENQTAIMHFRITKL